MQFPLRLRSSWLGIVPPICAMLLFFLVDHWTLVNNAILRPTAEFGGLLDAFWSMIFLPIDLVTKAVKDPDALFAWARDRMVGSDGSMFKLATHFPSIFWLVGYAVGFKTLAGLASDQSAVS